MLNGAAHYQHSLTATYAAIPVAERSKARVCGRSLAGIAGSNLASDMDVCVVWCTIRPSAWMCVVCRTTRTKGKSYEKQNIEERIK